LIALTQFFGRGGDGGNFFKAGYFGRGEKFSFRAGQRPDVPC